MSTDAALAKLAAAVAVPPERIKGLSKLGAAELDKLTTQIQAAERAQAKHLEGALDGALSHLPMLLRGPVKKILFG